MSLINDRYPFTYTGGVNLISRMSRGITRRLQGLHMSSSNASRFRFPRKRLLGASVLVTGITILFIYWDSLSSISKPVSSMPIKNETDIRGWQKSPEFTREMERFNEVKPKEDDPDFVKFVRANFIMEPNNKPYNLDKKNESNPSDGQLQSVLHFFENTNHSDAFFIEVGALQGEWLSNTLYLEKELGWNGLLIESEPVSFNKLVTKNRKAWMSNACVSPKPFPLKTTFYQNLVQPAFNGLTYRTYHFVNNKTEVQCIPLATLLLALNQTVIDFFSLDLEGSELNVLRTIPFDKIVFKVLAVEVVHIREGSGPVKDLLTQHGYKLFKSVSGDNSGDLIFTYPDALKPGFRQSQNQP